MGYDVRMKVWMWGWAFALALLVGSSDAEAFCGFYVAGADAKLFNNATMVVMMRDGQRTVLSMQNNYQGPPENFAMVVPVPVVLQEENVKTLKDEVFERVDKLAAPRLVEYWEQDPCYDPPDDDMEGGGLPARASGPPGVKGRGGSGVKVEAEFTVGEYEIVILSASDSSGLDTWLKGNGYSIPDGAEPLLRPYVEEGSKFFVAKVDTSKVKMKDGQAMLSPLRFHYDTDAFRLPVRLGLMNSNGTQDLIVHILAQDRYEVANYDNATIPTNLDLTEGAKGAFPAFYAALFDETLKRNEGAVVTEYAWAAATCDPCPSPPLRQPDFMALGGDVIQGARLRGSTLTRLHARYGAKALGEDLVFKKAEPIVGGREFMSKDGKLETGSQEGRVNNFQGRYAIRHPWKGEIDCENPRRGVWGGPPHGGRPKAEPALDLAFAPRGQTKLASLVTHDVEEIDLKAETAVVEHPGMVPATAKEEAKPKGDVPKAKTTKDVPPDKDCGCRVPGAPGDETGWPLAAFGLAMAGLRRRRGAENRQGT